MNNPQLPIVTGGGAGACRGWRSDAIVDDSIADNGTWPRPAARIGNERFPRDHSGNVMMGDEYIFYSPSKNN